MIGSFFLVFVLQFCNQTESINQQEIFPDKMSINAADYNEFVLEYNAFVNGLDEDKKESLNQFIKSNYIDNKSTYKPNGRVSKSECSCSAGQSTCSAETWASDCCICCAAGKSSVCGSYLGISICKCDDNKGGGGGGIAEFPSDGARLIENQGTINVYPNRFFGIFSFLEKKSVDVKSIKDKFVLVLKRNK